MLVIALAIACFVLGVLGVINAFSFPPSLSSQSLLMVLANTARGLSFTYVSMWGFFLIML